MVTDLILYFIWMLLIAAWLANRTKIPGVKHRHYWRLSFQEYRRLIEHREKVRVPLLVEAIRFKHAWWKLWDAVDSELRSDFDKFKAAICRRSIR